MISPSATNPDISTLGNFVWRICMTDSFQGQGLAKYSVETLSKKNVAIIYDGFRLPARPGRCLCVPGSQPPAARSWQSSSTPAGIPTSRPSFTKIEAASPQSCSSCTGYYSEGSKITRQARELGLDVQLLGSDGYAYDALPKLGGTRPSRACSSRPSSTTRRTIPAVQKFVAAYKAKYNGANPDWFAANSYDVVMLAATAAKNAGKNDRTAINDALGTIGTYQGISGPITFDENGDVVKPLALVVVQGGHLVTAPQQPAQ